MEDWRSSSHMARHWQAMPDDENGRVECRLCPRHCKPRNGQFGFCRVRGVVDGHLHTFNYGKSVAATEEVIETEAVYHFSPGARILSLGNIGCMMSCRFCQNWETSQVRHLNTQVVQFYSPQQIVDLCRENGIGMISWTYNDPVVWHEFVVDTSRLAQKYGIRTLYKSAFYIEENPVKELLDCIDIFSLSLKSMDEAFYWRITKGMLRPILDRIRLVHQSGRHLEISQLLVTDMNDGEEDIQKTIQWVLNDLGNAVPLHFVGFHPAYQHTHVGRTPLQCLLTAQEMAKAEGIRYCYLGNVYQKGVSDTHCPHCHHLQVVRFGLTARVVGLDAQGRCGGCGRASDIKGSRTCDLTHDTLLHKPFVAQGRQVYFWTKEVESLHVVLLHSQTDVVRVRVLHQGTDAMHYGLLGKGVTRMIVSQGGENETGIVVEWDAPCTLDLLPVLDRAHFPIGNHGIFEKVDGYVQ